MIVNYEDIRNVRPIADNIIDEKRIFPYIREAELLDVLPAIGAGLYKQLDDLTTNNWRPITTNTGEVIQMTNELWCNFKNGTYYEHACEERFCTGIIAAVAYLAYARFVRNNSINVTAFGNVYKQGQFSEPVDERALVRHTNEAEKIGREYLSQCVDFLIANDFICKRKNVFKPKFKVIGI